MYQRSKFAAQLLALSLVLTVQAFAATNPTTAETTINGRLTRTVEAGGWLIAGGKQKYLLLNAARWQSETWFREGAEVEAMGEPRPDTITTYQEGVPFEARTLQPRGGAATGSMTDAASGVSKLARVIVSGDATVQARPDRATISVAVVTQGRSALEAQQENARRSEAVGRAVKASAGAGAEVQTSGYSLQPQYNYRENQPPTIRGYEARNTVVVTLDDLTKVGPVIDAASGAGANNVDSLAFSLRRDRPARDEALAGATREALNKARVIAGALGGRVVRILEVQESGDGPRPIPLYRVQESVTVARTAAQTPVAVGSLDIKSQVQLVAEIMTGP